MKNTNIMKGNGLYQMSGVSPITQPMRMGDANMSNNIAFNPTQRETNQLKTAFQVQNYEAQKQMAAQGRTDMRGNVVGYSDTLG